MSEKKLYRVTVEFEEPVLAENEEDAIDILLRAARMDDLECSDSNARELTSVNVFSGIIPWGSTDDKTVDDYFPLKKIV